MNHNNNKDDEMNLLIPQAQCNREDFVFVPMDILLYIFAFLESHDLRSWPKQASQLALVSREWYHAVNQDIVWHPFALALHREQQDLYVYFKLVQDLYPVPEVPQGNVKQFSVQLVQSFFAKSKSRMVWTQRMQKLRKWLAPVAKENKIFVTVQYILLCLFLVIADFASFSPWSRVLPLLLFTALLQLIPLKFVRDAFIFDVEMKVQDFAISIASSIGCTFAFGWIVALTWNSVSKILPWHLLMAVVYVPLCIAALILAGGILFAIVQRVHFSIPLAMAFSCIQSILLAVFPILLGYVLKGSMQLVYAMIPLFIVEFSLLIAAIALLIFLILAKDKQRITVAIIVIAGLISLVGANITQIVYGHTIAYIVPCFCVLMLLWSYLENIERQTILY